MKKMLAWLTAIVSLAILGFLSNSPVLVKADSENTSTASSSETTGTVKTELAPGPYAKLSDGELIPISNVQGQKNSSGYSADQIESVGSLLSANWTYWKTTYEGRINNLSSDLLTYIGIGATVYGGPLGYIVSLGSAGMSLVISEQNAMNAKFIGDYLVRKWYTYPDTDGVNVEYDSYIYKYSNYTGLVATIKTSNVMQHIPLH
ncbi:hypothetical protein FEI15_00955 [Lacticaseibacillus zeae]|uniref:Uncharacterized protein n=1 Tax=Lacticaseibacillus zeae TaxID=57037 RepID=A0A5R8M0W4_LACZE|nr:hypothetical protein [Lacticaseibacillus zeae]TLF41809.1 hypothetical protein FEI15_00955 [Lacticaseibacillus zeae]